MPPGKGWRGVETVLGRVDGLKRFVDTMPSAYHGLNFLPGHRFRNAREAGRGNPRRNPLLRFARKNFQRPLPQHPGRHLKFQETLPDDGDVDMPRALRTYREVGFDGMIMPDHVPQIAGDTGGQKAFAFCFGYIQALLQQLRAEA